jgi:cytochrome c oxidase subunit 4
MMDKATTHAAHGHGHPDDGRVHAHVSRWQFLVGVFGALIFLTFITVYVSYFDFGAANTFIAVLVATMKATLVALFFMHLRYDKPFHGIIFVMAFVFLGLLLLLSWDDLSTRGRIDDTNGVRVLPRTGEFAPGSMQPDPRAVHGATTASSPEGGHTSPANPAAVPAHGAGH